MKLSILATAATVGLSGIASAGTLVEPFTSYYAFGDSLTDDGKLGILVGPPSFDGRFSTGPTYAEYIAGIFEATGRDTNNLAVGGATAVRADDDNNPATPAPSPDIPLADFDSQLTFFLGSLANILPIPESIIPPVFDVTPPEPGTNPLASVLLGPNDIFGVLNDSTSTDSLNAGEIAEVQNAANAVVGGLIGLQGATGGLFNDFLVIDLPDLGIVPRFLGTDDADIATQATNIFNAQLEAGLQLLESGLNPLGPANIYRFSLNAFLNDVVAGTIVIPGVTDFTTPCTETLFLISVPNCFFVDPALAVERLFADEVHPNGQAHAAFAQSIIAELGPQFTQQPTHVSAVPLPAGLPLLLVGLGGFAVLRKRRNARAAS